jgi:hypothetical protein
MISIIRVGSNPGLASGSRIVDALNNDFIDTPPVKKFIIIKKIDPEEYEDQGVEDMAKNEDFEINDNELDDIESEIPDVVDQMSDEELDDIDFDDEFDDEFDELDGENISEKDLDDIEAEIPPEVDELKDEDLLEDDDIVGSEGQESKDNKKEDKEESKKDNIDDYI